MRVPLLSSAPLAAACCSPGCSLRKTAAEKQGMMATPPWAAPAPPRCAHGCATCGSSPTRQVVARLPLSSHVTERRDSAHARAAAAPVAPGLLTSTASVLSEKPLHVHAPSQPLSSHRLLACPLHMQTVGLLPTNCPPAMDSPALQAAYAQSMFAYVDVSPAGGPAKWADPLRPTCSLPPAPLSQLRSATRPPHLCLLSPHLFPFACADPRAPACAHHPAPRADPAHQELRRQAWGLPRPRGVVGGPARCSAA